MKGTMRLTYITSAALTISMFAAAQQPNRKAAVQSPDGQPFAQQNLGGKAGGADSPQTITFTYSTLDYPRVDARQVARAINDRGRVIGLFASGSGSSGYLQQGKTFKLITYPGALSTVPWGINETGTIVGLYLDGGSNYHGFILKNGTFTTIDVG